MSSKKIVTKKTVSRLLKFSLISSGVVATAVLIWVLSVFPSLPSVISVNQLELQIPLRIYSNDGRLIGEYGTKRRTPISYNKIPTRLIEAFLSAEDSNFFNHFGISILGLARSFFELVSTGRVQSGGSTITMQLSRNLFLSPEQTLTRKFKEILLSFKIESKLSKEQILELYLNKIYLGKRAYGVEAAANVYYGKPLADLSLAQLAMVAGLPKAPSRYNPVNRPERALTRRNWILGRMLELDYITEAEYQVSVKEPVTAQNFGSQINYETGYINEMVRNQLQKQYGSEIYTKGFNVYTTIDLDLQKKSRCRSY